MLEAYSAFANVIYAEFPPKSLGEHLRKPGLLIWRNLLDDASRKSNFYKPPFYFSGSHNSACQSVQFDDLHLRRYQVRSLEHGFCCSECCMAAYGALPAGGEEPTNIECDYLFVISSNR